MHRRWNHLLMIFLLATAAGAQQKPTTSQAKAVPAATPKAETSGGMPSEETVNAFMREMFAYNPVLTWKVADIRPSEAEGLTEVTVVITSPQGPQSTKLYITPDGEHALVGDFMPFGEHPFAAAREILKKNGKGVSRGPADAPVTMVEFSDLQCPHCKAVAPILDKLLGDEKNARLIFENFPLPGHDWAAKAAAYADCIGRSSNDAFWKFVQATFDAQADITAANADEKLNGIADAAGAKSTDIAACAAKPETVGRVQESVALGQSVRITGTPTIFINGRRIENVGGVSYEVLKQLVEFAAKDAQEQAQAK